MDINEKKEKLLNKEITVFDLTSEEAKQMKEIIAEEMDDKRQELNNLNKKIKGIKEKIDNWAN